MTAEGKPKVAFYWCASCGGCEEAVVDLAEGILDVVGAVDIVMWPVAMDFKRADIEAMPDESILEVDWDDLDRAVEPDHLTSLYLAEVAEPVAAEFARFDELVRVLRERCPWDREQTHETLRRHLLEEAHEVIEVLGKRPPRHFVLDVALLQNQIATHGFVQRAVRITFPKNLQRDSLPDITLASSVGEQRSCGPAEHVDEPW